MTLSLALIKNYNIALLLINQQQKKQLPSSKQLLAFLIKQTQTYQLDITFFSYQLLNICAFL